MKVRFIYLLCLLPFFFYAGKPKAVAQETVMPTTTIVVGKVLDDITLANYGYELAEHINRAKFSRNDTLMLAENFGGPIPNTIAVFGTMINNRIRSNLDSINPKQKADSIILLFSLGNKVIYAHKTIYKTDSLNRLLARGFGIFGFSSTQIYSQKITRNFAEYLYHKEFTQNLHYKLKVDVPPAFEDKYIGVFDGVLLDYDKKYNYQKRPLELPYQLRNFDFGTTPLLGQYNKNDSLRSDIIFTRCKIPHQTLYATLNYLVCAEHFESSNPKKAIALYFDALNALKETGTTVKNQVLISNIILNKLLLNYKEVNKNLPESVSEALNEKITALNKIAEVTLKLEHLRLERIAYNQLAQAYTTKFEDLRKEFKQIEQNATSPDLGVSIGIGVAFGAVGALLLLPLLGTNKENPYYKHTLKNKEAAQAAMSKYNVELAQFNEYSFPGSDNKALNHFLYPLTFEFFNHLNYLNKAWAEVEDKDKTALLNPEERNLLFNPPKKDQYLMSVVGLEERLMR